MTSDATRRPSTFLSLAPTTSASYPTQKPATPPPKTSEKIAAKLEEEVAVATAIAQPVENDSVHRRSSSTSTASDGSNGAQRYLKLGPVHWGEGDGKSDWSEAVAE